MAVILPWTLTAADLSWNHGWKFHLGDADLNADDGGWEAVSLPHTPRVESPNGVDHHFKGLCWYHKHFEAEPDWRGKKIQLRFDGAMQVAEVWLNGKMLTVHQGGYLPFTIDLTPGMNWYADNVVAVRLDNRDQPTIPPGKPLANLDFTYQGGLYRNVTLLVTDPLHISDVFEANRVAGGGIFVRTESADATNATIRVQADVQNDATNSADTGIQFTALDPRGRPVATIKLGPYHLVRGHKF